MLYGKAIEVLIKVSGARFAPAPMPPREEIEEAIQTVAGMATVQACPKYALHAALWGWRSNPKRWNGDKKR